MGAGHSALARAVEFVLSKFPRPWRPMDELKGLRVAILVVEGNLVARATEAA